MIGGCNASPPIEINKNIYVIVNGEEVKPKGRLPKEIKIDINYSTHSSSAADVKADQKGDLKIPIAVP